MSRISAAQEREMYDLERIVASSQDVKNSIESYVTSVRLITNSSTPTYLQNNMKTTEFANMQTAVCDGNHNVLM